MDHCHRLVLRHLGGIVDMPGGQQNWEEHAGILRAVIAGDSELAALLAARHVYNAAEMPQE